MKEIKEEYRRKLPHIQPKDAVYFVTFCLKGALPKHVAETLRDQKNIIVTSAMLSSTKKYFARLNYFEEVNDFLDQAKSGPHWLKEPKIGQIVADSFEFIDGRDLKLVCYCIMSNHVHFVAYKLKKPLFKIMQSLKAYTARKCNNELNRSGSFWQREYFDRVIRDRNDFDRKILYTINNPVKAGLVKHWRDYPYTYCSP